MAQQAAHTGGHMSRLIALLGAESTGKTDLSQALADHWRSHGESVTVIPEVLREWCDRAGRVPVREEQRAIAEEQARLADAAPGCDWLIADTTPLMIAVYSDLLFDDRSLYDFALRHQRMYDVTLVTGLNLPWTADGLRDGPHAQEPTDALLRAALEGAGITYCVVYGSGPERLENALSAIGPLH
jgi:nicotinamide riboside kinase